MNNIKYIYYISVPVILMAGIFVSCENDLSKIQRLTATDDSPDEIVNGLRMIFSDSGNVKFELIAERMEHYSGADDRQLFKNGFKINFFSSTNQKKATLSAQYGELRETKKLFFARNNVIFTNHEEGQTLRTEELFWDQATKKVRTDKYFEIEGKDGYWAKGYGMECDETFSDYKMYNVTASKYDKKENETTTPKF